MRHREFVYTGDPIPDISVQEHTDFLMNFQKAILCSLEKRKLLSASQRESCVLELEKQYSQYQRKKRQP